jgi:hypothetical protein
MRSDTIRLFGIAVLFSGLFTLASCGTGSGYYSSRGGDYGNGGYYDHGRWRDPYYNRPCCRGPYPGPRPPITGPPDIGNGPSIPSGPEAAQLPGDGGFDDGGFNDGGF